MPALTDAERWTLVDSFCRQADTTLGEIHDGSIRGVVVIRLSSTLTDDQASRVVRSLREIEAGQF